MTLVMETCHLDEDQVKWELIQMEVNELSHFEQHSNSNAKWHNQTLGCLLNSYFEIDRWP